MKVHKMQLSYTALVFVINIYVCSSGKEIEAHGSRIINNLNLRRQKRTGSGYNGHDSESRNRNDGGSSACSPKNEGPQLNTIIKSSASIANGAKFLNAVNGTSSLECFNMCCQDSACDTSIYEDKGNRRCYLFHCHGLCKFKEHSNYFVWDIGRQVLTTPPKEEEELAHLHDKLGNGDDSGANHGGGSDDKDENRSGSKSNSEEDASSSRTNDDADHSKMGTPYTHKSEPAYVAPHTAGLSDYCDSDVSCEDPNAGCFGHACHCKKDFYDKNGLCRKMCSQSDFECSTLGTSGRGPECIPKSNVCDSYMQCADGSDELDCGNKASHLDSGSRDSNPQQASSPWMMGQGVPIRDTNNYDSSNYNSLSSRSRQMPLGAQPVLQESQHFQHKSPTLSSDEKFADQGPMQPERKGYSYNQYSNNDDHPISNSEQRHGYDDSGDISMHSPQPSVRPINPMLSQPAKPSMNDQDRFSAKNNNNYNNQHVQGSIHNTNPNTAYPQPTNAENKANGNNNPNYNQNNVRGSSSQDIAYSNRQHDQEAKLDSNSYAGHQNAPPQPQQPEPSQTRGSNNPKVSLTQNHNVPSNDAYSENGRPPLNNGRDLNSDPKQRTQQNNHESTNSHFRDNSNTVSRTSNTLRQSKGRDGLKVPLTKSQQQRVPGPSKTPLPSMKPSSSVSENVKSKSQHNIAQASKSKVSSRTRPAVGPNNYPSSSLLSSPSSSSSSSSSSSRQQTSRQSWLDSNPYLAYGSNSGNQRQRQQQAQPSRNSQYYDPSQYFSQYNTDSLDALPPSLLGDTGSQDDFSAQFGGPYVDRQKPLNRMPYPMSGGGNSGYMGYPDSQFNSQYNQPNRYNYGGEFGGGTGNFQDADFYSPLRNSNKDYQSPGIYEDDQSGHRVPSSSLNKNKGVYPPGMTANTDEIQSDTQKSKSTSSSDMKGTDNKASSVLIPKTSENAPTSSHDSASTESVKNITKQSTDVGGSGSSSKTNVTHSTTTTTKKPHPLVKENSNSKVFVTQEKVIIASSTSEAEGPIIALSLGLAFTLILIGLLGCRLRNMKHRLRKGRPLNSNEADYLINGMYL